MGSSVHSVNIGYNVLLSKQLNTPRNYNYGYGILRLSDDTPWKVRHLFNFVTFGLLSALFQTDVGLHELEIEKVASRKVSLREKIPFHNIDYDAETRGEWYYRQALGSSNFTGSKWLHIMSGNLSHQIEHHMFPDIPGHRYHEMSSEVKVILEKYGMQYNTASFFKQYKTVIARIARYSLPSKKITKQANLSAV